MDITEANAVIDRYPHHNVNKLYELYKDPNFNNSWWGETLLNICYALDYFIAWQKINNRKQNDSK